MKKLLWVSLGAVVVAVLAHLIYLWRLTPQETYPADTFLAQTPPAARRALIVVAHDDDAVGCAGTIGRLCQEGWEINQICFYSTRGRHYEEANLAERNVERKQALAAIGQVQGLRYVRTFDTNLRIDAELDTCAAPYLPIPKSGFATRMHLDTIETHVDAAVREWQPTVIFCLDDQIGGYGHPEHVAVSQVVRTYCQARRETPGFPVQRIYQSVFPPSQSEKVLRRIPAYQMAKQVYGVPGMPPPTVQADIRPWAGLKKQVMQAYTTEQQNIQLIFPAYSRYPAAIYFGLFDREFFHVLEVAKL